MFIEDEYAPHGRNALLQEEWFHHISWLIGKIYRLVFIVVYP